MAISYYDDAIVYKLKRWVPDNSNLKILGPDESNRLFNLKAYENNDKPITLPFIALSRDKNFELLLNIKNKKSFEGLKISGNEDKTLFLNVIPISVNYQLDIYTKTYHECEEYVRNFLFKLINNPTIIIDIPYNGTNIRHTANLRVLSEVSDTSSISERLFEGQFTRWSISIELQDGFLFNIPYRKNWHFVAAELETKELNDNNSSEIEEISCDCK